MAPPKKLPPQVGKDVPQPKVDIPVHEKLLPFFFESKKVKVAYGGRNGSKTWAVAAMLLLLGTKNPLKILCLRETMASMDGSVHEILSKQIIRLKLQNYYTVEKSSIYGMNFPGGERTEFIFKGIRRDVDQVRSTEGVHITWVEEAHNVSKQSWRVLLPTIFRRSIENGDVMDSELWITFNPHYEDDETYVRWVTNAPPGESIVVKINYTDLPEKWVSPNTRTEIERDKLLFPDEYPHIWLGECKQHLEGAVFEREIKMADKEGYFLDVTPEEPLYDPSVPVEAFYDLGRNDCTAIWVAQKVGPFIHIIDYIEDTGYTIDHYLDILRTKEYKITTHWLPHDAANHRMEHQWSIEEQVRNKGNSVRIVPRTDPATGINAVRTLFHEIRWDEYKCKMGLDHIKRYRWEVYTIKDGVKRYSDKPVHDEHSHAADALRYLAIALKPPFKRKVINLNFNSVNTLGHNSWMAY